MTDPYARLAVTLWFLSNDRVAELARLAEEQAVEAFEAEIADR
jgi:hypothetical protein